MFGIDMVKGEVIGLGREVVGFGFLFDWLGRVLFLRVLFGFNVGVVWGVVIEVLLGDLVVIGRYYCYFCCLIVCL